MVIINKIREHFKNNYQVFQLEQFDQNTYKLNLKDVLFELDNIAVVFDLDISQLRKSEDETNSSISEEPFINVEFKELWLGETEIRLTERQIFTLECILINSINVI